MKLKSTDLNWGFKQKNGRHKMSIDEIPYQQHRLMWFTSDFRPLGETQILNYTLRYKIWIATTKILEEKNYLKITLDEI